MVDLRSLIILSFVSCGLKHEDQSKLNVTNGRIIDENYLASVVRTDNCTATFVRHNVLLTLIVLVVDLLSMSTYSSED